MTKILKCTILFLVAAHTADAKLLVRVDEPTRAAKKILMKVSLKNTFGENVDSARATLFLFNDQDKMVGQSTQWIIGGTKDKPALAPNASATFNFVIPSDKPFTKTKLIFNRIILEGGKQVDPAKNFEIKKD
jgi:hypothetical protein